MKTSTLSKDVGMGGGMDVGSDGGMEGQTEGQREGQMEGWMDGQTEVQMDRGMAGQAKMMEGRRNRAPHQQLPG